VNVTDTAPPAHLLDDLDRRIVAALQVDPRATWGQIGAALAVSETTVLRRVQRLRDSGVLVILGAPDPLRSGTGQPVLVQFRTTPGAAARVAKLLAERADIRFVALLTGGIDVICEFLAPDHRYLSQVLLHELPDTGEIISTTTEVVLRTFKTGDQWSFGLLTGDDASALRAPEERPESAAKSPRMDHLDIAIIAAMGADGRRSYADLSAELGLSETAIARRVSALMAHRKLYFVTLVDPRVLGFELEVLLHLRVDRSELEPIAQDLASRAEVRYLSATAGYSDLACEAVFRDTDALYNFMTHTLGSLTGIRDVEAAVELETVKRAFRYPLFAGLPGVPATAPPAASDNREVAPGRASSRSKSAPTMHRLRPQ
jgi:DNA-binding Lrp family transcriptional regulator